MAGGVVNIAGGKVYEGKTTVYVVLTCVIAATGGLMFGYDVGISGGVISMNDFLKKFFPEVLAKQATGKESNYCKYNNQKVQAFTSSLYIAGLVATYAAAFTSRKYGRRFTMRVAAMSFVCGTILSSAAQEIAMLIIGRITLGVGVGFANQAVPLFLSEMAPTHLRGGLNILFQLAVTMGILFANLVNYGSNKVNGWGWRLALGLAGVPAVALTVGSIFILDTPNSLIERGKLEEGKLVLLKVRGVPNVDIEYQDLLVASEVSKKVKHPFKNIIQRHNRPQLVISFWLQVFQQFTGINAIMFYAPVLFQSLGFESSASLYSAVIVGTVNVLSTIVAIVLVDKVGRRKLLLESGGQMFIAQVTIGIILAAQMSDYGKLPHRSAVVVIVLICVYVSGFAWSWGPLGWLIPSEIFPLETRAAGLSFTVSSNLIFTVVIAQSFLSMLCSLKFGIFFFFTAWIVIMTISVYFLLPETKGIPIEEMQHIWGEHWFWHHYISEDEIQQQEMKTRDVIHNNKIYEFSPSKV